MSVKFNEITAYSRWLTIFFVLGVFPAIVFFIGKRYQETVTILKTSEAETYRMATASTYEVPIALRSNSEKTKQDAAGEWVSDSDKKYAMRIKDNNTFYDYYEDKVIASGSWILRESLAGTEFADLPKGLYLQKSIPTIRGEEDVQFYNVVSLNKDKLVMNYLGRGNTLSFSKK